MMLTVPMRAKVEYVDGNAWGVRCPRCGALGLYATRMTADRAAEMHRCQVAERTTP